MDRNTLIGNRIVATRKLKNIQARELAEKLGISSTRLSNWETGSNGVSADFIFKISEILDVSADYLIGLSDTPGRPLTEIKDTTYIVNTLATMRRLNDNGQGKVADYADDLDKSGQYKRTPAKPEPSKVMELPESYFVDRDDVEDHHIDHAAAAGRPTEGIYNGFAEEDDIMVRKDEDRPDYDKVIEARGNSMEPLIMSGDVLFLRYQPTANTGDIVVVRYLECVYVKKFIKKDNRYVVLRSINPDVPDRTIDLKRLDDPNDFRIIALVVDWETPIKREQLI